MYNLEQVHKIKPLVLYKLKPSVICNLRVSHSLDLGLAETPKTCE